MTHEGFAIRSWRLSAPESYVLLTGPDAGEVTVLELAMVEMLVRRRWRFTSVRRRRFGLFMRNENVLYPLRPLDSSASPTLHAVDEVYVSEPRHANTNRGLALDKFVADALNHFRQRRAVKVNDAEWFWNRGGYVQSVVLPELYRQGLYDSEQSKRLGLFETTRWTLTPSGFDALSQLRRLLEIGRTEFAGWARTDRTRADDFAATAGAAMLLLTFPPNRGLPVPGADRHQSTPELAPIFGLAALTAVYGPGPMDGLDTAFSTIHSSVESAASRLAGSDGDGGGGGGE